MEFAEGLGVTRLNCLAGKRVPGYSDEEHWTTLRENVRYAAAALQAKNLMLLVEAINHFDLPEFFLNRTKQALKLIEEVALPNIFLQYDIYHAQREEGEIVATLRRNSPKIGHIQIADNPGRHQPGTGEINYPFVLKEIDAMGYEGFVGLEYRRSRKLALRLLGANKLALPPPLSQTDAGHYSSPLATPACSMSSCKASMWRPSRRRCCAWANSSSGRFSSRR